MLSHFHLIPERHGQTDTDGRTHNVRQTDLLYQYRASGTIFNDRKDPFIATQLNSTELNSGLKGPFIATQLNSTRRRVVDTFTA